MSWQEPLSIGRKTLEFLSRAVNWNWAFSKRRDNAMAERVQPIQSVLTGPLQDEEEPEEEESLQGQWVASLLTSRAAMGPCCTGAHPSDVLQYQAGHHGMGCREQPLQQLRSGVSLCWAGMSRGCSGTPTEPSLQM